MIKIAAFGEGILAGGRSWAISKLTVSRIAVRGGKPPSNLGSATERFGWGQEKHDFFERSVLADEAGC
jgi:hypothetical protein